MPKGGHARSGPAPDPTSRTSERKGFTQTSLPAKGYAGTVPDLTDYLPEATDRHEAIWQQLWRTPQACMWARDTWMAPIVADLVRCQVRSEHPDAPAAWETPVQQKRTELGLTPSGLRFLGWAVAHDEVTPKREAAKVPTRRRLRAVDAQ